MLHCDWLPYLLYFLVEEADIEDDAGNVIKEVYVQPVVPLEFHARYRLGSDDPESSPMGVKVIGMAWYVAGWGLKSPSQCMGQLLGPADHPPVWQLKLPVEALIAS